MLVIAVVFISIVFLIFGFIKAPPDKALVISGIRKQPRILVDRIGMRIPFLERIDSLYSSQITVPVNSSSIPTNDLINVNVEAVIEVKICLESELMMDRAIANFLNKQSEEIIMLIQDALASNMREIITTLSLKDLSQSKDKLSKAIRNVAADNMHAVGLEIVTCNIQNVFVLS